MGFRIISLDGREGTLAHTDLQSPFRVGRYGVHVEDIDAVGVRALELALEIRRCIVIDEIGSMELFSRKFLQCVLRCLDAPLPVLGTIQKKRTDILNNIRARSDVDVMEITMANRDRLPQTLLELLQ